MTTLPPLPAASAALVMRLVKTWRSSAGKPSTQMSAGRSAETVTPRSWEAAFHEEEQAVEHVLEIDGDGRLGLAVEAEHGAADLGDAASSSWAMSRNCLASSGVEPSWRRKRRLETESSGLWISWAMVAARRPATASFSLARRAAWVLRSAVDVAEDHDDAGEGAVVVADGGAAVVDAELGAVFADEDGVVGEADDAVETLDLGDGIFDVFAVVSLTMLKMLSRAGRRPRPRSSR